MSAVADPRTRGRPLNPPQALRVLLPAPSHGAGGSGSTALASGPVNPIISTVIFERVPPEMRGRVLGVVTAGAYVAIPLGALVAGFAVDALGVGGALLVMVVAWLVVTATIWLNPGIRQMGTQRQGSCSAASAEVRQAT